MDKKLLKVIIKNKEGTIFEEDLKAVTSFNEKGVFDVLPLHENFISIVKNKIILHKENGEKNEMSVQRGVLKVSQNSVNIYLGI